MQVRLLAMPSPILVIDRRGGAPRLRLGALLQARAIRIRLLLLLVADNAGTKAPKAESPAWPIGRRLTEPTSMVPLLRNPGGLQAPHPDESVRAGAT